MLISTFWKSEMKWDFGKPNSETAFLPSPVNSECSASIAPEPAACCLQSLCIVSHTEPSKDS